MRWRPGEQGRRPERGLRACRGCFRGSSSEDGSWRSEASCARPWGWVSQAERAARAHCRPRVAATGRDGGTDSQRRAFLASLWGQGDALRKLWAGEGPPGTDPEVELHMLEAHCPVTVSRWEKQAWGEADVCSLSGHVGGSCWKLWGWGGPSACSQTERRPGPCTPASVAVSQGRLWRPCEAAPLRAMLEEVCACGPPAVTPVASGRRHLSDTGAVTREDPISAAHLRVTTDLFVF